MLPLCNVGNTIIEKYIKDYCIEKLGYNPSEQYSDSSFSGIVKFFRKKETHEETLKKLFGYLKIPKYLHKIELQNDEIIDIIIDLSEKYIYDRKQPDKAIDILDEVCAKASLKENKLLKEYNDLL